jgi:GNAT superfamily N-acetyltransferase
MSTRITYERAKNYIRRHSIISSINRIWRETKNRALFYRHVLYARDLLYGDFEGHPLPEGYRVENYEKISNIPVRLIKRITEHYSERILTEDIKNRYGNGACLWCLRNDTEDFGYTWSLVGRAMNPYYFPLLERDTYFFDVFIFPKCRGRGLNSVLMNYLLKYYKSRGCCRAFIETLEWNTAEMRSLAKNGFIKIGLASKRFHRGKCKVTWWYEENQ